MPSAERRREIYALCRRYDIWIIEDDAYFYLQYNPACPTDAPGLHGLSSCCTSYLSMDADGRVIRLDTFAKFLAPGLRLGWVTARADVIAKLTSTIHSHTVGPCGISQALTSATLTAWGEDGLHAHLQRAQSEYAGRAAVALAAADTELKGIAEWGVPRAGMFLWVKLLGVGDSTEIWEALKAEKVVLLPGRFMHCRAGDATFQSPFVRISFSNCSEAEVAEGIRRVGRVVKEWLRRQEAVRSSTVVGNGDAIENMETELLGCE
jgi:kynurenine/2-aminoadipate aminotransferase